MLRTPLVAAAFCAASLAAFGQVRPIAPRANPAAPPPPPEVAQNDTDAEDARPQPNVAVTPPPVAATTPVVAANAMSTPPPLPARPGPAIPGATAAPNAPSMVKLQFPNSDVDDVLRLYEQLTGAKLVRDNFVQGRVNIFISKDVPRDEAITIIEMNLLMNGFSLVPAGHGIIKVIGTGKSPRSAGVPIISDESQIPEGDHVISFLFKLRYADPTELQQVLAQYLQPPQPYTSFQALPKASAILVTENSSVIRTISKIIDQIDIPPAEVVSEFIKLERADASKVVDMLKDIFEKGQNQPGQPAIPGGVRTVRPPAPQMAANQPQPVSVESDLGGVMALSEESVVVGKIKLTPDVRTNRIHVVTRPINMPFVRKLIAEFDANVEFAKPVTRPLKYISAGDVLPVLVQALTEPGANQQGGGAEGLGPQNPANQQQQQNRQNRTGTPTNPYQGGMSNTATDSNLNISEELSTTAVDTTPKSVSVGNAKIIADQRANSIIMLGNREVVVKVAKILDEMDVPAPQVALSTVIGELTLNNDEQFGVDWFMKYRNRFVAISRNGGATIGNTTTTGTTSTGTTATGTTSTGSTGTTTTGSTGIGGVLDPSGIVNFTNLLQAVGSGTNIYVSAGNFLATAVSMMEATGKFKVVSRPTVFTSNNKKAIIASGQEVPVPVSSLTNLTNGTVTNNTAAVASNIEYKKIALQLEVVPLINSANEVSLDILQKIDSIAGSQIIDNNSIPTIATRYIRTNVSAPNCSTIVLGGLITEDKRKQYNGIPVLSRIPLIGAAFRNTTNNVSRQELVILMRPEVSLTKVDLHRLREKTEDRTHFGPELEQDDCPNCPKHYDGKELPAPDLPPEKTLH